MQPPALAESAARGVSARWTGRGTDGSGDGYLLYALAEKRCENFATCVGLYGALSTAGSAKVNSDLFSLFNTAQTYLYNGECSYVRPVLNQIIQLMQVRPMRRDTHDSS